MTCLCILFWDPKALAIAGVHKKGQSCSWSASCATASSTSASCPGAALQAAADLSVSTHPASNSQLSTVTAVSGCASEAARPDHADPYGQGCLAGPLSNAETASCTAGCVNQAVDGTVVLHKAGLLVQCLMNAEAVVALLGFNAGKAQLAEHDVALQTQTEAPIKQSQTAPMSQPGPKAAANLSTAVVLPGGEAVRTPVIHQLTNPSQAAASNGLEQDVCTATDDSGSGLLAILGLGAATEGSGRGATGTGWFHWHEEDAGLHAGRLSSIALDVIEVLLDASLTQPKVSLNHHRSMSSWLATTACIIYLQTIAVSAAITKACVPKQQLPPCLLLHECMYALLPVFVPLFWHFNPSS